MNFLENIHRDLSVQLSMVPELKLADKKFSLLPGAGTCILVNTSTNQESKKEWLGPWSEELQEVKQVMKLLLPKALESPCHPSVLLPSAPKMCWWETGLVLTLSFITVMSSFLFSALVGVELGLGKTILVEDGNQCQCHMSVFGIFILRYFQS